MPEIEHKRMAGPMMLGNSAIRSTDRLAGKRLTQAEIEQALGHKYSPPARTDFDTMRAEFNRLYGSQATAAPARDLFSVFEVTPQGQWQNGAMKHHTEDLVRYLASELGLKSVPRVRWFTDPVRGLKSEPGWKAWNLNGRALPWGFFDPATREVWVKDGLSYHDERQTLAHELRHCQQFDAYGPGCFYGDQSSIEADANAFGEKYR